MRMSDAELKALYQASTTRAAAPRSACPPQDDLVALVAGISDRELRDRIADHVMACADCAQEIRLLRSLTSRAADIVSPLVPDRGRLDLEALRQADGGTRRRFGPMLLPARVPLAIAASLLIAIVGLGVAFLSVGWDSQRLRADLAGRDEALANARRDLAQTARRAEDSAAQVAALRRNLETLQQPQANVPIIDLDPRDALRGAVERPQKTVEVAPGASAVVLILNIVGEVSYPDYALEILDATGSVIWLGRGLERSPLNTFTVTVPRVLIDTGLYRFKLYGVRDGDRRLIQDYAVRFHIR